MVTLKYIRDAYKDIDPNCATFNITFIAKEPLYGMQHFAVLENDPLTIFNCDARFYTSDENHYNYYILYRSIENGFKAIDGKENTVYVFNDIDEYNEWLNNR